MYVQGVMGANRRRNYRLRAGNRKKFKPLAPTRRVSLE